MSTIYDFSAQTIDGDDQKLDAWRGKTMLIVNVASKCGLTPQYEGLEALYRLYRDRGLAVLGFPSNDFDDQEPGSHDEIAEFCRSVYGVDFPMFAKLSVRGPEQSALYRLLTSARPRRTLGPNPRPNAVTHRDEADVRWNFEKFLVSRAGDVVDRFDPDVIPLSPQIVSAVEAELAKA